MNNIESSKGEIVMYQPDETIRLEVRMGEETVWLTQQQMAELFDKDRTVISRHIRNIYKEEELEENITCAKFAHMGSEGDQTRNEHRSDGSFCVLGNDSVPTWEYFVPLSTKYSQIRLCDLRNENCKKSQYFM